MYQQPNHSYTSTDSLRRLSSNNPFRQYQSSQIQSQPSLNLQPLQPYANQNSNQQTKHLSFNNTNTSNTSRNSSTNNFLKKSPSLSRRSTNSTLNTLNTSNSHFDDWVEKNKNFMKNHSSDDDNNDDEYFNTNNNSYTAQVVNRSSKDNDQDSQISPNKILSYYQNNNTSIDSINNNINNNNSNNVKIRRKNSNLSRPVQMQAMRADSDSSVNYNYNNNNNRNMKSNNPFASAINDSDDIYSTSEREPLYQPPVQQQQQQQQQQPRSTPPARPPKPQQDDFAPPSYEEAAGKEAAKREYRREKEHNGSSSSSNNNPSSNGRSREHRSGSDPNKHRSSSHHASRSHRKSSSSRNKSPSKKRVEQIPAKNLDTIDKLDVTGFFGGGFHHDGPFDACTPHRNKNVKQAPVMAFPVDGPNNSIAGSGGNVSKDAQMKLAFGNYDENDKNEIVGRKSSIVEEQTPAIKTNRVSNDPSSIYTPKHNPSVINFDATAKTLPVHGYSTEGLGSTTFIDGAPAPAPIRSKSLSRSAKTNYKDDENSPPSQQNSFLRRVKSLKHRTK
ncbi:hypothetical protein KGF54_003609 [Candida jiufengensis]|uniref:uncharacterized protein n=1 Tax=Candida jiufengensis TaxID=497108 RepID=UPI00222540F4|nr:uncharacterized protein KGF54_003609 [Candida jiufengensis]KAI5952742.1 hypothetical protein KGF54_003609 [Candida jiufengensis]